MSTLTASSSSVSRAAALSHTRTGKVVIVLAATAVVAAAARVSIPLPFTPVPLSLAPLAVLGVGLALGPVEGFLALLAYLAEGAIGLPVFSSTGPGGFAEILGPNGGYLMAYPFVAALAGAAVQALNTRTTRFAAALIAGALSMALLFVCGALWFAQYVHHSLYATLLGAVVPFLPGEIVKVFVAAGIYSTLTRSRRIA